MAADDQLKDIFSYYSTLPEPRRQENIVAMLREIQDLLGCVPQGVLQQAADAVGEKASVLSQLVRLYPSLKSAAYRHRIVACSGQRCGAKDGAAVYKALCEELQPDRSGLCGEGQILLCTQNCLKHCGTAPNLLVDGVLRENMTPQAARQLARSLLEQA